MREVHLIWRAMILQQGRHWGCLPSQLRTGPDQLSQSLVRISAVKTYTKGLDNPVIQTQLLGKVDRSLNNDPSNHSPGHDPL